MKYLPDQILRSVHSWTELRTQIEGLGRSGIANKKKGDVFERFLQLFFTFHPDYAVQLETVWLEKEIPDDVRQACNLPSSDRGIDLLARTKEGAYWTIQAKYRTDPEGCVPYGELGTFGAQTAAVARGITRGVICTTKIEKTLDFEGANFEFRQILLDRWESLGDEFWEVVRHAAQGRPVKKLKPYTPRPYQEPAINAAKKHFITEGESRGKLIMACGTGKSLIGYWTAVDVLSAKTILVAVPTLDLIRQTYEVWARESVARGQTIDVLIVCSDSTTARGGGDADINVGDLQAEVTTDSGRIKSWVRNSTGNSDLRVVFVTYQSGIVLAKAAGNFSFDVGLFDEAHKTAGREGKRNQFLLYQKNVRVHKRVFLTATERYYHGESDEVVGMNDTRVYGHRYHYLSFGQAIKDGVLADYKVVLFSVSGSEVEKYRSMIQHRLYLEPEADFHPDGGAISEPVSADDLASAVALRKAFKEYKLTHAVSFHARNLYARDFVTLQRSLNGSGLSKNIKMFRVSSNLSAQRRGHLLNAFESSKNALISNARCLTEGVNVPEIDLVMFAQPRQSKVDVVQAVGRALRKPANDPEKQAYVLLPILIEDDQHDIEQVVNGSGFENLVSVLKAMSTVDEDVAERITVVFGKESRAASRKSESRRKEAISRKVDLVEFLESLRLRAWDKLEGFIKPRLTIKKILELADAHKLRTGKWPISSHESSSESVPESPGESWRMISVSLRVGLRGLPGGSSLAKLLERERGVRNRKNLPPLTEKKIVKWADAHYESTGEWPGQYSGPVLEAREETWRAIQSALYVGNRGLPGGSSIAKLLAKERRSRNRAQPPDLTEKQILKWADVHHNKNAEWPGQNSGVIYGTSGETWSGIDSALSRGSRSLPGGLTLAKLLARERGVRHIRDLPDLTEEQILNLAVDYHDRTGKWPSKNDGEVNDGCGDTWRHINYVLRKGRRGLPGGSSLAKLLNNVR